MTDEHEFTLSEIEQHERESIRASGEHAGPERFPRLFNLSVGFDAIRTVRAIDPEPAECLAIRVGPGSSFKLQLAATDWNKHWEAAEPTARMMVASGKTGPIVGGGHCPRPRVWRRRQARPPAVRRHLPDPGRVRCNDCDQRSSAGGGVGGGSG
jgi:hypothetical protein